MPLSELAFWGSHLVFAAANPSLTGMLTRPPSTRTGADHNYLPRGRWVQLNPQGCGASTAKPEDAASSSPSPTPAKPKQEKEAITTPEKAAEKPHAESHPEGDGAAPAPADQPASDGKGEAETAAAGADWTTARGTDIQASPIRVAFRRLLAALNTRGKSSCSGRADCPARPDPPGPPAAAAHQVVHYNVHRWYFDTGFPAVEDTHSIIQPKGPKANKLTILHFNDVYEIGSGKVRLHIT